MAERRASLMDPRIEQLMGKVDSKFTLVTLSSMRAREINDYYNQLGEGLGRIVPPQVTSVSRKPLSIAMEEVAASKITYERIDPEADDGAGRRRRGRDRSRRLRGRHTGLSGHEVRTVTSRRVVLGVAGRHRGVQGGRRLPPPRRRRACTSCRCSPTTRSSSWAHSRSRRWPRSRPARRCSAGRSRSRTRTSASMPTSWSSRRRPPS